MQQGLINYWFRHICEFVWPLYPGIALASVMSGMPVKRIILCQSPFALLWGATGWLFFLRNLKTAPSGGTSENTRNKSDRALIFKLALALVIFFALIMMGAGIVPMLASFAALIFGASAIIKKRAPANIFGEPDTWKIAFFVFSVFLLKNVLREAGFFSDIIEGASGTASALFIITIIIPALTGFFSGLTMTAVGIAFPLIHALGPGRPFLYIIAYMAGYLGILASPLHLCLTITAETSGARYFRVLRKLSLPLSIYAAAVLASFFVFLLLS